MTIPPILVSENSSKRLSAVTQHCLLERPVVDASVCAGQPTAPTPALRAVWNRISGEGAGKRLHVVAIDALTQS
jgi:hypothetical protein